MTGRKKRVPTWRQSMQRLEEFLKTRDYELVFDERTATGAPRKLTKDEAELRRDALASSSSIHAAWSS